MKYISKSLDVKDGFYNVVKVSDLIFELQF